VPASLPVKELESYFRGRIRNANSVMNEERIVARLRAVEKVAIETAVLLGDGKVDNHGRKIPGGLNRRVVIDEDRHCAVCHKRFGGSAIRVYPDNSVVHSGCLRGSVGRKGTNAGGWR
jgi:Vam6/Vps39-like protein vacuolar protein sorting-associated protein 39